MYPTRIFRRRITTGFSSVVLLAMLIAAFSLYSLRSIIGEKDLLISDYAHALIEVRAVENASEHHVSSSRAFLLTEDPHFLETARSARQRYGVTMQRLRSLDSDPEGFRLLERVDQAAEAHQSALDEVISIGRRSGDVRKVADVFETTVTPRREALRNAFRELIQRKERLLEEAVGQSREEAQRVTMLVASLGAGAILLASALFFLNSRSLMRLARVEAQMQDLNGQLERRVEERTEELRSAAGELEGFAYSIAHDLRAPLRAMAGLSEFVLAESGPHLDKSGRDDLCRIVNASRRMDDLIQGLLELIRLSYTDYAMRVVDVRHVVDHVIAIKRESIRAHGAHVEIVDPFPDVVGNPALVKIALEQLVSNALEFTKPGVPPHVRVYSEVHASRVRIIVQDNGLGIPGEYHDRIFGVFHHLHKSEDHPGVGIGLSLMRRVTERMGGTVGLASEPGSGSLFWIDLADASEMHLLVGGLLSAAPPT